MAQRKKFVRTSALLLVQAGARRSIHLPSERDENDALAQGDCCTAGSSRYGT